MGSKPPPTGFCVARSLNGLFAERAQLIRLQYPHSISGMDLPASAVLDTLLLPLSGASKQHKTIVGGGLLPIAVCQSAYL
ncbi:YceK/YidQ family lipoprotein [Pseudomonas sp. ICBG1301]|uniref:YceK/YidQ family lipoprotein n=1 Tax=Pseudomonas sp. ICBG1301 TaxID=2795987 RepID=UPI00406C8219